MNILFISHHDNFQGSSRSLMSLLEGLQELGVVPFVVNPRESLFTEALRAKGIHCAILPVPWWVSAKTLSCKKKVEHTRVIWQSVSALQEVIKDWKIDLVYTNSSVTPIGLLAARKKKVPHIWHIREYFDLYFGWRYIFPAWFSKKIFRGSDAIICHARGIQQHYFPSFPANVYQVYNGVASIPELESRLQIRLSMAGKQDFTFAMLSNINPKKGQEFAIRALAKLRDEGLPVKLLIVGNGIANYVNHLQQTVVDFQLTDCVTFTGLVDDPFPYYFSADCVLICSDFEALSRVGLEAMSTALPVIGKNSGGNPEVIADGETGFLYNTFDELVEAMLRLAQNPTLGQKMGLAGWQRAKDMFNIEDYAANVYKVIQLVMDNR
ncbi:MAG: glycosyltransferase family 4 protein [Anaerolineaceae bacterium]|nr:glycosyltransferase family 4 protein [Anaerolineaceae bacterium]MDD4578421.1 glycosyltransferase family 4 protein [Anaerolineaceae bacterium]